MSIWLDKNPAPPSPSDLTSKPKYNIHRSGDKAYNLEHTVLVHEWKEKILYPAQKADSEHKALAAGHRENVTLEVNSRRSWDNLVRSMLIEDADKSMFIKKIIEVDE